MKKNKPELPQALPISESIREMTTHVTKSSQQLGHIILSEFEDFKTQILDKWHHLKIADKLDHFVDKNKAEYSEFRHIHELELNLVRHHQKYQELMKQLGEITFDLISKQELNHPSLKKLTREIKHQSAAIKKSEKELKSRPV